MCPSSPSPLPPLFPPLPSPSSLPLAAALMLTPSPCPRTTAAAPRTPESAQRPQHGRGAPADPSDQAHCTLRTAVRHREKGLRRTSCQAPRTRACVRVCACEPLSLFLSLSVSLSLSYCNPHLHGRYSHNAAAAAFCLPPPPSSSSRIFNLTLPSSAHLPAFPRVSLTQRKGTGDHSHSRHCGRDGELPPLLFPSHSAKAKGLPSQN